MGERLRAWAFERGEVDVTVDSEGLLLNVGGDGVGMLEKEVAKANERTLGLRESSTGEDKF